MKVSQAIEFHLQYQRANSKKNTVKTCEFVLSRFAVQFTIKMGFGNIKSSPLRHGKDVS